MYASFSQLTMTLTMTMKEIACIGLCQVSRLLAFPPSLSTLSFHSLDFRSIRHSPCSQNPTNSTLTFFPSL
ncbi:hypothetical protein B0I35DRAFT_102140 [Stachybotrys elegans]|uniref:Uncharacterized protein n=1 Tax=Stachybotrys elegans TaxID=80388 RepID=A0A8K0SH67_9HYPO|nr:hypothetical protein B0I35DRAFT_102140 [Stachybotrys elegans]